MAEGAIWNPTVVGTISKVERKLIDFKRGKTLEKFAGNIKGLPGALLGAKDADRALATKVEQIKSTYAFRTVRRTIVEATEDAGRYILSHATQMGKSAQAVGIFPTGTPGRVLQAAENAVTAGPGVAAPKVVTGIPGPVGVVGKLAAPVGALLSIAALPEDIKHHEYLSALSDALSFVSGSLETGAMALSAAGGTGAAGSTPLIGAGGVAGAGLATGSAVTGGLALGVAGGVGLEKTLNVSSYSSNWGLKAAAGLKALGVNDTVSHIAGAYVTIEATPIALVSAAIDKGEALIRKAMALAK